MLPHQHPVSAAFSVSRAGAPILASVCGRTFAAILSSMQSDNTIHTWGMLLRREFRDVYGIGKRQSGIDMIGLENTGVVMSRGHWAMVNPLYAWKGHREKAEAHWASMSSGVASPYAVALLSL